MQQNYWLHRISNEYKISKDLLDDKKYISIGWQSLCDDAEEILNTYKNGGKDCVDKFLQEKKGIITKNRFSILNMLEYKKNDIILVPLYGGKFSLYKVIGDIKCINELAGSMINEFKINENGIEKNKNEYFDIGFILKVQLIKKDICRSWASYDLQKVMKYRATNLKITRLEEDINHVKDAYRPIVLRNVIQDKVGKDVLAIIIKEINDIELEKLIKHIMEKKGASSVDIPAKNGSEKENFADADVIAIFDDLKIIFYIQVKAHKGKTELHAVKQIVDYQMQNENTDDDYTYISWVISTCDKYEDEAVKMAKENNVRLINGIELVEMLLDCGINGINEIKNKKE